jgi:7-cyano-7-deazaguanine synthase in queuosine biosynthesis
MDTSLSSYMVELIALTVGNSSLFQSTVRKLQEHHLKKLLSRKGVSKGSYDAIVAFSGGKDSFFVLSKLKEQNLRVLACTIDNGFLSAQAKKNIKKTTKKLGVDHIYVKCDKASYKNYYKNLLKRALESKEPLEKYVCPACLTIMWTALFKTAVKYNIPYIVSGFEARQAKFALGQSISLVSTRLYLIYALLKSKIYFSNEYPQIRKDLGISLAHVMKSTLPRIVTPFIVWKYEKKQIIEQLQKQGFTKNDFSTLVTNCFLSKLMAYLNFKNYGYGLYYVPSLEKFYPTLFYINLKNRSFIPHLINKKVNRKMLKNFKKELEKNGSFLRDLEIQEL